MYIREILNYFTMKKIYLKVFLFFLASLCSLGSLNAQTQTVVVGTSSLISAFSPIVKSYECVAYEAIYLSTEIGYSGSISSFGFNRVDGTDTLPFDSVSIFMKQTAFTSLTAGNVDTTGYTLVYEGPFPNNGGIGWREVALDTSFTYSTSSNLSVMVFKHTQTATLSTPVSPRWYYTSVSSNRSRRYYGAIPISSVTSLSATNVLSDIRITVGTVGIVDISAGLFSVYPNPTNGIIHIVLHNSEISSLKISDINGRIVKEMYNLKDGSLDLTNLKDGVYNLQFFDKSKNNIATRIIVVKR